MTNRNPRYPLNAGRLTPDGMRLLHQGQPVQLRGINLVDKGHKTADGWQFIPRWPQQLWQRFVQGGMNVVRLGVIWAAIEPVPGAYDKKYLDFMEQQLDLAAQAGIAVILDMHQDLYAQRYADGAPDWAVLTDIPFTPTALWSDAYLTSQAVQQCWDAFWSDQPAPQTGIGLQQHFAATWRMLAQRFGGHPALLGYDILNEPAPGSEIQEMFALLMHHALADLSGQEKDALGIVSDDVADMAAVFADPVRKLRWLDILNDSARYEKIGRSSQEPVMRFERETLGPFYSRVAAAIRQEDSTTFLLRGHNYISNIGVPPGLAAITIDGQQDSRQIFAPHGYDLVVDTEAIEIASDSRAHTIFKRHRQTQEQVNLPVIVGEWGAFSDSGNALRHGDSLMRQFEGYLWSSTYWCYEPRFFELPAARLLARPSARAVVGTLTSLSFEQDSGTFTAAWQEPDNPQEGVTSLFWAPTDPVKCTLDDAPCTLTRDDKGIIQIPAKSGRRTLLMVFPR